MVQAIIKFGENENRIINIVKGKFGLKNKSDAVNMIIDRYGDEFLEPELRPEYVERLTRIRKEKAKRFKSMDDLRKHIENA